MWIGLSMLKMWLRDMIRVLQRAFYGFRGVTTEASTAFRADEGGDSLRFYRRESVNNNIFDPVGVVTRMAAILVPIAGPCEWFVWSRFQRILVHLVIPQTIRTL